MRSKKALLVVDLQNDFCPGGALGVEEGDQIIPRVNEYVALFLKHRLPIFVSRDWHPPESGHFKAGGGPWPPHCIRETAGARFHPDFKVPPEAIIISKGTDPQADGYSVFEGHDAAGTSFLELLVQMGIQELYIAGIATDYCVRWSAHDALRHGFAVKVLLDGIKGVDKHDSAQALEEIVAQNGRLTSFGEVLAELV
ncbi:MAG: nicotinamidase [candidate division KSB1 bacterium]|nr:nicotinamidase [candidate division KSB1 bacterium]MDZ7317524.1 nicotinamidase [candidate division KSB1 bacterium]MDZ7340917.1 nicotinamidase [candidate division KSB1 bacterium]